MEGVRNNNTSHNAHLRPEGFVPSYNQACDSCRLRKMKCSKDHPTCISCKEHNWKCVYSPKSVKSPLTRAYLKQVEDKASNLERILRRMLPEDVEILDLIRMENENDKLEDVKDKFFKQINLTQLDLDKVPATLRNIHQLSTRMAKNDTKKGKKLELQPEDYLINIKNNDLNYFDERDDSNNASEDVYDSSIDGMAALSNDTGLRFDVNSSNGYFGINSSNGLLKFLQLKTERNGNSIIELNLNSLDEGFEVINEDENPLDEDVLMIWKSIDSGKLEDLLDSPEFESLIVKTFFERYYQVYPIINKKRFFRNYHRLKDLSNVNLDDYKTISFMVLLNTILAIGVLCKLGETSNFHTYYYQKVKEYTLKINLFEYSDTQLLDSFVLLSNYVQKTNKPNTGWSYLGLATRVATSLGLHKEVKIDKDHFNNAEIFEELEIRKRQWWGMYFFDVGTTLTFGRPLTIPPLSTIDLGPVSNVDDNLLERKYPIEQVKVTYPTIYTTLIYESELTKISTRVYNYNSTVLKLANDKSKMIGLLDMNELLESFVKTLPLFYDENEQRAKEAYISKRSEGGYNDLYFPKWFALSRLRLISRYKNLQILIFRYILWETGDSSKDITHQGLVKKCTKICFEASFKSVMVVKSFVDNNELDYLCAWYATYFLFQAILIPILRIVIDQNLKDTNHRDYNHDELFRYIDIAIGCFGMLKRHNRLARKFIKLINVLVHGKQDPKTSIWNDIAKNNYEMLSEFDNIFDSDILNLDLVNNL